MNWVGLFAALFVIQAGAAPQQQQQQQTRPQDRASITGFIVKMGSGEPVSKSAVTISAFNQRAQSVVYSDDDGRRPVFISKP